MLSFDPIQRFLGGRARHEPAAGPIVAIVAGALTGAVGRPI
jgi:hypothetical protein